MLIVSNNATFAVGSSAAVRQEEDEDDEEDLALAAELAEARERELAEARERLRQNDDPPQDAVSREGECDKHDNDAS